jgi:oligopeptide/dipeptide ABC transporter ATP-binding protein
MGGFSTRRRWIRAVDGISLSIRTGETLGLVGETGCGKTTTGRLILLLERPTAGSIEFDGQDALQLKGSALKRYRSMVQAVFQDPWSSLNPRMRVADIVGEPLVINSSMSAEDRSANVARLLREVGIDGRDIGRYPHEFSGGQRQRIALARALTLNSRVIVLDEPVSSLDVSVGAQIMNLLKELQAEHGISYLLIAHNLATVRYLSHAVAVMYLGRIVESADAEDVFSFPSHPYTQAIISASSLSRSSDRIILTGEVPSPLDPPTGCHFHPRCPLRARLGNPRRCETEDPGLRQIRPGHSVACHFAEDAAGGATVASA